MQEENPPSSASHLQHASTGQRVRAIMGACSGNLIEWYDFFIYSYTSIYFAAQFFPSGSQTSQLMATAGIFAVGFLMRPLGGWLFGFIADTRGRKLAMIMSIFLMCGGSLMIGVLPTHAAIGIAAPMLLVAARLMQGLSVGAEYGTGATYISEVSTKGQRAFFGSFQYATIIGGQLVAMLIIVILQHLLSEAQMKSWGWRLPFLLGAAGALVVVYLRRAMIETASAADLKKKHAGSLHGLLKAHPRAFCLTVVITMGCSLFYYTFTSYMQKYLVMAGMAAPVASAVMTSALVAFMIIQALAGKLADRIGTRNSMLIFATLATVFSVPLLTALKTNPSPLMAFLLVVCGLAIAAFYTPVTGVMKADLYPASVRALGVGLPYAIGNALCGGTAEYVALMLRSHGAEQSFFYYVATVAALTLVAAYLMPDLRKHGYLDGDGAVEANTGVKRFGARKVEVAGHCPP